MKVKCLRCNKILSCRNNYYRHKKLVHEISEVSKVCKSKVFTCKICFKIFPKMCKLTRHEIVHTRANFTCIHCGEFFQRERWYNMHISICELENDCATMITCLNGITGPAESEGTVTVNFVTDNIHEGINLPDVTDMTDCNGTVNIIPDYDFGGIDLNLTVTGASDCNVIGTLILLLMLLVVLIY